MSSINKGMKIQDSHWILPIVYLFSYFLHQSFNDPGGWTFQKQPGSYFRRFRNLAFEYYNLGRSKPALIELWPRILANYDARFLLCPPAALQAQLLQIEERGFLERPETVTEQLLGKQNESYKVTIKSIFIPYVGICLGMNMFLPAVCKFTRVRSAWSIAVI